VKYTSVAIVLYTWAVIGDITYNLRALTRLPLILPSRK
jgi:hypothetical protein